MSGIQGVYIALFGRPADPAGLAYFTEVTKNGADLSAIGNLAGQPEYQERFKSLTNEQVIQSIYKALFNREADAGGLKYFVESLESGRLTINNIAVAIAESARSEDKTIIENKIAVAEMFTKSLDTPEEIAAYTGTKAADVGRSLLSEVTADKASIPDVVKVASFLRAIEASAAAPETSATNSTTATDATNTTTPAAELNTIDPARIETLLANLKAARAVASQTEAALSEANDAVKLGTDALTQLKIKEESAVQSKAALSDIIKLTENTKNVNIANQSKKIKLASDAVDAKKATLSSIAKNESGLEASALETSLAEARKGYMSAEENLVSAVRLLSNFAQRQSVSKVLQTELQNDFMKLMTAFGAYARGGPRDKEIAADDTLLKLDPVIYKHFKDSDQIGAYRTQLEDKAAQAKLTSETALTADQTADGKVGESKAALRNAIIDAKSKGADPKLIAEMEKAVLPFVTLSKTVVLEKASIGDVVSEITLPKENFDDFKLILANDAGGQFELKEAGGKYQIVLKKSFDVKSTKIHDIKIEVSDTAAKTDFDLSIKVNSAPVLSLSADKVVYENVRSGTIVGKFSATDDDGDQVTLSITGPNGEGYSDRFYKNDQDQAGIARTSANTPVGEYNLHVSATDAAGNVTLGTIKVTSLDVPFVLSSAPTGKNYISAIESLAVGKKLGIFNAFSDDDFNPVKYELTDNPNQQFVIEADGSSLALNKMLDYETAKKHTIKVKATDKDGNAREASFDIHVVDAAEVGATSRGTITIDASQATTGINYDTYINDFEGISSIYGGALGGLKVTQYDVDPLYTSKIAIGAKNGKSLEMIGEKIAYRWDDFGSPEKTGEDVHVVTGKLTELVFRNNDVATGNITQDLAIRGLDLENDSSLLNRILGDANIVVSGLLGKMSEATTAHVHGIFAKYAQNFLGSAGNDTFTGTIFADTARGDGGNDIFDGGAGLDTAIFSGAKSDYAVSVVDGKTIVKDQRTSDVTDGTDTLVNFEVLKFSDVQLVATSDASGGLVWA